VSLESLLEGLFEQMEYLGITIILFIITIVYMLTKGKDMDRLGRSSREAIKKMNAASSAWELLEDKWCDWCRLSGYSGDKKDYDIAHGTELRREAFPYIYPVSNYTGFPEGLPISSVSLGSELQQKIGIELEKFPSYLCEKCFNLAGGDAFFHRCKLAGYTGGAREESDRLPYSTPPPPPPTTVSKIFQKKGVRVEEQQESIEEREKASKRRKKPRNEPLERKPPTKEAEKIEDPLTILKIRYAKGEITEEEYEELKQFLEQS